MAFKEVAQILEVEFKHRWQTKTRIAMQNVKFKPKKDAESYEVGSAWVRFNVLQGRGEIAGIGAATHMYRYVGIITVNVFTVAGTGTLTNRGLCDEVATIFRSKQFAEENITCQTPNITEVGETGEWWQINVDIPFYWEEFTNP